MNGAWEGVKRGEGLCSLHLGRGGMPDLPHNISRKVSKRVRLDLQSGGGLADGPGGSVCRKSGIKIDLAEHLFTSGLAVSA
jgi:hypothetical protein